MNKEQAQDLVKATLNLSDHYNETGFKDDSMGLKHGR